MTGINAQRLADDQAASATIRHRHVSELPIETPGSIRSAAAREIKCFTGLRGCAAVLVMLYHLTLNMPPDTMPLQAFLLNGYLWVDLFFVLSGFVMAYSQASFFAGGYRPRQHLAFLASRLARIYPLYVLVTVESAIVTVWRGDASNITEFGHILLLNLALIQAWGLAASLEGASWSISTEWGAYLLFPALLAWALGPSKFLAGGAAALALASIIFLAIASDPLGFDWQGRSGPLDIYSAATAAPLLRCVAEFMLGLLAFRVWRASAQQRQIRSGKAAIIVSLALAIAISLKGLDAGIVVLFAALLVSLAPQAGVISDALSMPVPYRLGQWSYSIYLIHDKFSHFAATLQNTLSANGMPFASCVTEIVVSALVILLGAASFYYIERPMRRWLGRLSQKNVSPAVAQ